MHQGGKFLSEKQVMVKCKKAWNDRIIILDLSNYTGVQGTLPVKCSKCGYEWEKRVVNIIHRGKNDKNGCPKCSNLKRRSHEDFVEEVKELGDGQYQVLSKYRVTRDKILFLHKECGETFEMKAHCFLTLGQRCPFCRKGKRVASKGEERVVRYLKKHKISFVSEKSFKGLRGVNKLLQFDFYIESHNLLIEYDGPHHFGEVTQMEKSASFNGYRSYHERVVKNDRKKTKFAEDNGIHLVRIHYLDYHRVDRILTELFSEERSTTSVKTRRPQAGSKRKAS